MADLLDFGTVWWLLLWAGLATYKLAGTDYHSIYWVIIAHCLVSGLPIALDHVVGVPGHVNLPGFSMALQDTPTRVVYDIYMCLVPLVLYLVGRPPRAIRFSPELLSVEKGVILMRRFWWGLLIPMSLPIVLVLISPNPALYRSYAAVLTQPMTDAQLQMHSYISLAARLSIGAAALLLLVTPRLNWAHILFVLPWITAAVWIDGKRGIVAMIIVMMVYVAWLKGFLRGYRILVAAIVALSVMGLVSFRYQSSIRDISSGNAALVYENARMDFGRDAQIKMSIFAELNPDKIQILDHRGQSLLFYATMYVPREIWQGKPYTYATYYTNAMLLQDPQLLGWGMTTSWLDEAISNLSWFGLVAGPLVPAMICRISDSRRSVAARGLGALLAILLLMMEFVAFAPLALVWIVFVIAAKPAMGRIKPRSRRQSRRRRSSGFLHVRRRLPVTGLANG